MYLIVAWFFIFLILFLSSLHLHVDQRTEWTQEPQSSWTYCTWQLDAWCGELPQLATGLRRSLKETRLPSLKSPFMVPEEKEWLLRTSTREHEGATCREVSLASLDPRDLNEKSLFIYEVLFDFALARHIIACLRTSHRHYSFEFTLSGPNSDSPKTKERTTIRLR